MLHEIWDNIFILPLSQLICRNARFVDSAPEKLGCSTLWLGVRTLDELTLGELLNLWPRLVTYRGLLMVTLGAHFDILRLKTAMHILQPYEESKLNFFL